MKKPTKNQMLVLIIVLSLILLPKIFIGIKGEIYNHNLDKQSQLVEEIVNSGDYTKCFDVRDIQSFREKCFIGVGIRTKDISVCQYTKNNLCRGIIQKNYSTCRESLCEDSADQEKCSSEIQEQFIGMCKEVIDDWNNAYES
ncbi:hypothetical protein J4214_04215 [Candidatus Woesearchaeota archaeon]|nr:hypothetical protein [Candidatus Woesearchaeota archaeon]